MEEEEDDTMVPKKEELYQHQIKIYFLKIHLVDGAFLFAIVCV